MSGQSNCQDKNFLDTFGYLTLKLPNSFDYDKFKSEVISASANLLRQSWGEISKLKRSFIVPAFADNSEVGSDFLINYLDDTLKPLLGENYLYLGSDASIFFAAGSAWHRDLAMRLPVLKLNIYLDFDPNALSCDFLIIPGSHHVTSAYSSLLQNALAWPDKSGHLGGLSESGFLPGGSDPTAPGYSSINDPIPSKTIRVRPGAAVIFNTAAIHAVKSHVQTGKPRRLVTYIFCTNPLDLSHNHYARAANENNLSNEALLSEVYLWKAAEAVRFGATGYGEGLLKYPTFIKEHGLDWAHVMKLAETLKSEFSREDGSHEQAQMKQMSAYLTQNLVPLSANFKNQSA